MYYIAKISYKEANRIQKLEVKQENVFKLLEMISRFDDLDIIEILIIKDINL